MSDHPTPPANSPPLSDGLPAVEEVVETLRRVASFLNDRPASSPVAHDGATLRTLARELPGLTRIAFLAMQAVVLERANDAPFDEAWDALAKAVDEHFHNPDGFTLMAAAVPQEGDRE